MKKIELVVERGQIVKIDGIPKELNTNLTISMDENFLEDFELINLRKEKNP